MSLKSWLVKALKINGSTISISDNGSGKMLLKDSDYPSGKTLAQLDTEITGAATLAGDNTFTGLNSFSNDIEVYAGKGVIDPDGLTLVRLDDDDQVQVGDDGRNVIWKSNLIPATSTQDIGDIEGNYPLHVFAGIFGAQDIGGFQGDGSSITGINASHITTGTIDAARLPGTYSGYSGYSGKSGYSGYSGSTGTSGYSGYSGLTGTTGSTGSTGTSGYSGISGYSGTIGATGSTGSTGTSGYSGISGYSGKSGYSGYSGTPAGYSSANTWTDRQTFTKASTGNTVSDGAIYVNPASSAGSGNTLFGVAVNGTAQFYVDDQGCIHVPTHVYCNNTVFGGAVNATTFTVGGSGTGNIISTYGNAGLSTTVDYLNHNGQSMHMIIENGLIVSVLEGGS